MSAQQKAAVTKVRFMAVETQKTESLYAVIRSGGKQYRVSTGQTIKLDKLSGAPGEQVKVEEVLLVSSSAEGQEQKILVGTPLVSGASVTLKLLGQSKEKKVRIFKKKRRTGYTKRQGHRQQVMQALVENISLPA